MARLVYNNQSGLLGASLTSSGTTITFATAPNFATISGSDYIPLVLQPGTVNFEIVYLTAYTALATTGTIARAQEDSTNWPAVAHSNGTAWACAPTVYDTQYPYNTPAGSAYGAGGSFGMSVAAVMSTMTASFLRGGMTTSTHGLTVPVSGLYAVNASTWQTMGGANSQCQVYLSQNGTTTLVAGDLRVVSSGSVFSMSIAGLCALNAGDTIAMFGISGSSNTSGINLNTAGYNYINAFLVSTP